MVHESYLASIDLPMLETEMIPLPEPRLDSSVSLEHALATRRTIREIEPEPLTRPELSQLLWAAQGITDNKGHRTAPSGYAVYPLTLYVVADRVDRLDSGTYKYRPHEHALEPLSDGPNKDRLVELSGQEVVKRAAVALVIAGDVAPMKAKVGARAIHSLNLEAGHVAQNVLLQATALELAATPAAGFDKEELELPEGNALYMVLVGKRGQVI